MVISLNKKVFATLLSVEIIVFCILLILRIILFGGGYALAIRSPNIIEVDITPVYVNDSIIEVNMWFNWEKVDKPLYMCFIHSNEVKYCIDINDYGVQASQGRYIIKYNSSILGLERGSREYVVVFYKGADNTTRMSIAWIHPS